MGLTLYSELECQGKSVVIKDKEVNLSKAGLTFNAKVCIFHEIHQNYQIIFVSSNVLLYGQQEALLFLVVPHGLG